MRLDICGTIRGEGRAACGQVLRLLHDRTEKMRPARRLQMNCVDERRSSSEGIRHLQVHVAERSSPPGILVEHRGRRIRHGRGHGGAAVGWFCTPAYFDAPRTEAIPRGSALPSGRRMIKVRAFALR